MPISKLPLKAMGMTIRWGLNRTMLPAPLLKEPQDRGTMNKNPPMMTLLAKRKYKHKEKRIFLMWLVNPIDSVSSVHERSIKTPRW